MKRYVFVALVGLGMCIYGFRTDEPMLVAVGFPTLLMAIHLL